MLYITVPPLFKVSKGKTFIGYAYSDEERDQLVAANPGTLEIQRYKGLGEMSATQLWETTMDPERRTLIQITMDEAELIDELITICMGEAVAPRKQFILDHAREVEVNV